MLSFKVTKENFKDQEDNQNENSHRDLLVSSFNYELIEKSINAYETHRSVLDEDTKIFGSYFIKWVKKR